MRFLFLWAGLLFVCQLVSYYISELVIQNEHKFDLWVLWEDRLKDVTKKQDYRKVKKSPSNQTNWPDIPMLVLFLDHHNCCGSTFNIASAQSHCCVVTVLWCENTNKSNPNLSPCNPTQNHSVVNPSPDHGMFNPNHRLCNPNKDHGVVNPNPVILTMITCG